MKRCINWLINWFVQWVEHLRVEEKIGFGIAFLLAIIIGVFAFISLDIMPATPQDYKKMKDQVSAIESDPSLVLKTVSTIYVEKNRYFIHLENSQCELTAIYDQDFKLLSTAKEDKSTNCLVALGCCFILILCIYAMGAFFITLFVFLLKSRISHLFHKIKTKFQEQ